MTRRIAIVVAVLIGSALPAAAGQLTIDWSSNAARAGFGWNAAGGLLRADAGWLHDEDLGDAAHLGLHVVGDVMPGAKRQLRGGLGGRAYWADVDIEDGVGVGVGGFLSYRLMGGRTRLEGAIYVAPDALTGDGLESLHEFSARLAFEVVPRAELYFGYRRIEVELDTGLDVELDDNAHVGLRLLF